MLKHKCQNLAEKYKKIIDLFNKDLLILRYLIALILVIQMLTTGSCKKEEPYSAPTVQIISPEPYQTIHLPAFMHLQLNVASGLDLKYIKVGVDDENIQPLFEPKFFYPEGKTAEIDDEMFLGSIPPEKSGPFYLHISVDDHIETNHFYQQIQLSNTIPQQVIGLYLMTRPTINRTRIDYYNLTLNKQLIDEIKGEYLDAEEYSRESLFYVATSNQSSIIAYQFDDEQQPGFKWQHFPELPYAEITDLYMFENTLFAGSANGTIDGLNHLTGIKTLSTDIAMDSIPKKIGVSQNHIIGDFHSRKNYTNAFQSFYYNTGYFIKRKDIYYSVVDFYPYSDGDSFYFFGTTPVNGLFGRYHIPTNSTFQMEEFDKGVITHTCQVSESEYVLCTGKDIYQFNVDNGKLIQLKALSDTATDLTIDKVTKNVYVALPDKLQVYSYPSMELLNAISSDIPIKGIRLRYVY
jgi:hypothetical protein